jgi:hypothetical protein
MSRALRTAIIVLAPVLAVAQSANTALQRDASVSGRVVDASGAPIPTARVLIGTIGYREGRGVFIQSGNAQPDGMGNYSIQNVGEGEYYVRLEASPLRGAGAYYPGTVNIGLATSIPVQAGHQVVGIDFAMPTTQQFKVSGKVLNFPALPAGSTTSLSLSFTSADPDEIDSMAAPLLPNLRRGVNDAFEITLPPGLWDVFPVINLRVPQGVPNVPPAVTSPAQAALVVPTYATGRTRVRVTDRDVENVSLAVGSADVKGRVVYDGANPIVAVPSRITLQPLENTPPALLNHLRTAQQLDASGNFSFLSVPPGLYAFQMIPLPSGFYVAEMRVGTRSILGDGVLSVGTDPLDPIEITLRRDGGRVEVAGPASGTPVAPLATGPRMVLAPAKGYNPLLYRITPERRNVPFVFNDITPGDYKVFAFLNLPQGGAEQNAAFMAKYEALGVPVHVEAGQNIKIDEVKWIP